MFVYRPGEWKMKNGQAVISFKKWILVFSWILKDMKLHVAHGLDFWFQKKDRKSIFVCLLEQAGLALYTSLGY